MVTWQLRGKRTQLTSELFDTLTDEIFELLPAIWIFRYHGWWLGRIPGKTPQYRVGRVASTKHPEGMIPKTHTLEQAKQVIRDNIRFVPVREDADALPDRLDAALAQDR